MIFNHSPRISATKYPDPDRHFSKTKLKLGPTPRRASLYYTNPGNPKIREKMGKRAKKWTGFLYPDPLKSVNAPTRASFIP